MSETRIRIIHCDNCGTTMSGELAEPGWEGWFRVQSYGSGNEMDYCSGKCLFEHAGVGGGTE